MGKNSATCYPRSNDFFGRWSRYRASEDEHQKFARKMEGELVISITPSCMLSPKGSDTEQE